MHPYKQPPKTILPDHRPHGPSQPHLHYQTRNSYLSSLSDKYSSECKNSLPNIQRNIRIGYYLEHYQQLLKQKQLEDYKNNCFLLNQHFPTVFADCIEERRESKRQEREEEKLKEELQRMHLARDASHEQPQHDTQIPQGKAKDKADGGYETILCDYRSDPVKQKQLYLLDLQIGKLQIEKQIQKKVKDDKEMCKNYELVSKLSNHILSAYLVHFDEIYNALIDEILTEEVYYLNYIEAHYKVEKAEWNLKKEVPQSKNKQLNAKTIEMMELVKRLDDLCDQ